MARLSGGVERQRDSGIAIARLFVGRQGHPVIVPDQSEIDSGTFHIISGEGTVKDISRWSGVHVPAVEQRDMAAATVHAKRAQEVLLEFGPVMPDPP